MTFEGSGQETQVGTWRPIDSVWTSSLVEQMAGLPVR